MKPTGCRPSLRTTRVGSSRSTFLQRRIRLILPGSNAAPTQRTGSARRWASSITAAAALSRSGHSDYGREAAGDVIGDAVTVMKIAREAAAKKRGPYKARQPKAV